MIIISKSPQDTINEGALFAKSLKPGDVVLLKGELGCGKTTFMQGVAKAFGIKEYVRSSSFVLANEYKADGLKIYHIDLYRLAYASVDENWISDYMNSGGICVIEWPERLKKGFIKNCKKVDFKWKNENTREIKIQKRKIKK